MYKKQQEIIGHSGAIYTCTYDQQFFYTGSADHFVTRWNLEEGIQDKFAIKMDQSVYAIEFINSNNQFVVGLSNGSVHVFDIHLKKELKHFTQHIKAIFAITNNAKQNQFYVGDSDGNLSIWDSVSLELLIYLPLDCGKIRNITVSNDGELFSVSCQDGTTRIFETVGFNEIVTLNSHRDSATVSHFHPLFPDILLTGGKDALLKVWNWKKMELLKSIPAHNFVIYSIVFLENGKEFATASRDKTIKIWNSSSYKVIQRLDQKMGGHRHSINSLFNIKENSFASVGDDKKIIIWQKNEI